MKIQIFKVDYFLWNTNVRLDKNMQGGKMQYILCQGVWRMKKKTYQGGLVSAWNAFRLNVFTSTRYLRWWGKLFHAKEPEKEKLVLKISVLVRHIGRSLIKMQNKRWHRIDPWGTPLVIDVSWEYVPFTSMHCKRPYR